MIRSKLPFVVAAILSALLAHAAPESRTLFGQTREEFAARRAKVRAAGAVALFFSPGDNGDVGLVRYRTTSNFLYLAGVESPGAVLAILPSGDPSGKKEILFLSPRSAMQRVFEDPGFEPNEAAERATGIESVRPLRELWNVLGESIRHAKVVRLEGKLGSADVLPDGSEVPLSARYHPNGAAEEQIARLNPNAKTEGGIDLPIYQMRLKKSGGEISNLRGAIAATGTAIRRAARAIRPGVQEIAVEGEILSAFRAGGAVREGFPSIVGSGPNSIVLHHFAGERRMNAGEVVVVDIGAEYNYYSADVTRTMPVSGRFTARQRAIYQLVLDAQRACEKAARPGATLSELHGIAVQYMRNSPLRAKDSSGNLRSLDAFFSHFLGHWLGMEVHDVTGISELLEPGCVFTIEPGIYIPSEGIGFRIEDDYLVTSTGVEKLSRNIPCEVADIERLMAGTTASQTTRRRR